MNMADNRELIERDSRLPGLEYVLSSSRVQELLRSKSAIHSDQQVELDYVRYKPGRRALSLMHIVDQQGGRQSIVVNACDDQSWEKVSSFSSIHSRSNSLVLGDKRCSIHWFPHDRRLPQAAKLFDATKTNKVLGRVLGIQPRDCWILETLSYKPNRRLVVKASTGADVFVLKCYMSNDFTEALDRVQNVTEAKIESCAPILAGSSDRYSMIAFRWIDGNVMSPVPEPTSENDFQFYQAGALLADWHACSNVRLKNFNARHTGFSRSMLTRLAGDIQWLQPELERPLHDVLRRIDCYLDSFSSSCDIVHGDFYAKQIIVQNNKLRLIDFDEVGLGHRYQDLGTFVGNLVWNASRNATKSGALEKSIESFVLGYEHSLGKLEWPVFQASVVAGILRCLPHAFRRGEMSWPAKMHQMMEYAIAWCPQENLAIPSRAALDCARSEFSTDRSPERNDISHNEECSSYLATTKLNHGWKEGEFISAELADANVESAKLIRHKPGRRLVVEYSLKLKNGEALQTIGKSRFRKAMDKRLLKLHADLQEHRFEFLRVPRILGTLPIMQMWLQEKIAGDDITPTSPLHSHREAGVALAELHLSNSAIDRVHSVNDELASLRSQMDQWLGIHDKYAAESQWLLKTCNRVVGFLSPATTTIVHRDFYFDQAISCLNGTAFLDFDLASMGQPELDVGNYLAHLDEYGLRKEKAREACKLASHSFIEGYSSYRPMVNLDNVEIWRFLSLVRLAAISQRIPERFASTDHLILACRESYSVSPWSHIVSD